MLDYTLKKCTKLERIDLRGNRVDTEFIQNLGSCPMKQMCIKEVKSDNPALSATCLMNFNNYCVIQAPRFQSIPSFVDMSKIDYYALEEVSLYGGGFDNLWHAWSKAIKEPQKCNLQALRLEYLTTQKS